MEVRLPEVGGEVDVVVALLASAEEEGECDGEGGGVSIIFIVVSSPILFLL